MRFPASGAIKLIRGLVPVIAWTLILGVAAHAAEKRVALVIGNSNYRNTPTLINPKNDATDVAAVLKELGYSVVFGADLDKSAMDAKVREFSQALDGASVAVFFYAGHGLQVAGSNYLVPIDAKLSNAGALDFEMVRLDLIQRTMENQTQTNILFLDACRDNPLARNLARSLGTRSATVGTGLAKVESGAGTLISFSTQPGNVALDGEGRNSPYTSALVRQLKISQADLSGLLIDVRNEVMQITSKRQVPWDNSALTARFYFRAAPGQPPSNGYSSTALTAAVAKQGKNLSNPSDTDLYLLAYDLSHIEAPFDELSERDQSVLRANEFDKPKKAARAEEELRARAKSLQGTAMLSVSMHNNFGEYDPKYEEYDFTSLSENVHLSFNAFGRQIKLYMTNGDKAQSWKLTPEEAAQVLRLTKGQRYVRLALKLQILDADPPVGQEPLVIRTRIVEYDIFTQNGNTRLGKVVVPE
jgi:uncharacterized caspase-like protein